GAHPVAGRRTGDGRGGGRAGADRTAGRPPRQCRAGPAPGSPGMRAALRWLTGGPVPGPSWILAAVLLASCFLAAAAPRALGPVQTRVLQQPVTHAGPLDTVEVQSGWVTSPGSGPDPALLASTTKRLEAIQRPPLRSQPSTSWAGLSAPPMTVLKA